MMIIVNIYLAVTEVKHLTLGFLSLTAALRGKFHFPWMETKTKRFRINLGFRISFLKSHDELLTLVPILPPALDTLRI